MMKSRKINLDRQDACLRWQADVPPHRQSSIHWRCFLAFLTVALAAESVQGYEDIWKETAFATIDIHAPQITGTLWIELGAVEGLYPIDRNGDMEYSSAELSSARRWATFYVNQALLVMWQGRIHKAVVTGVELDARPGSARRYLRLGLIVKDYPPGAPVSIASRLLYEYSPKARCMALITCGSRREVFILGPEDYYRSHPVPLPRVEGSFFRPGSQRGRFASAGNWYLEMLYAVPEGAFYLYVLEKDRYTPKGIEAAPIQALITPRVPRGHGHSPGNASRREPTVVVLEPRPLGVEGAGRSSRFVAKPIFDWKDIEMFSVDLVLRAEGGQRRMLFDFPTVSVLSEEAQSKASRQFACPNLCLGVASKSASTQCPRCGTGLIEAHGAVVPGLGRIGRHGGWLAALGGSGKRLEALLVRGDELRLYLTNDALDELPVGRAIGTAILSTDQRYEETVVEIAMQASRDGSYLLVKIPETVVLPIRARCSVDLHDGGGAAEADFLFREVTPFLSEQATSAPAPP